MKILFLSNWFPFPPDNGSKIRIYNLIQALAENHEVTLITFSDQPADEIDFNEPAPFCRKIHVVARTAYNPKRLRALVGFLALTPRSLVDTFSVEMRRCIESTLSTEGYDIVIASQLSMARYAASFRAYPSLFDEIELGLLSDAYFQAKSILPRLRNGLTWTKQIHYIRKLLKDYDACTVVSEAESSLLQRYLPQFQAVEVIPNAIDLKKYRKFHDGVLDSILKNGGSISHHHGVGKMFAPLMERHLGKEQMVGEDTHLHRFISIFYQLRGNDLVHWRYLSACSRSNSRYQANDYRRPCQPPATGRYGR